MKEALAEFPRPHFSGSEDGIVSIAELTDAPAMRARKSSRRSEIAIIRYASESTSKPKGVVVSQENISLANARALKFLVAPRDAHQRCPNKRTNCAYR